MVTGPERWRHMALHAALAAVFIFVLQRFALGASLETSLLWAVFFAVAAAFVAWRQTLR